MSSPYREPAGLPCPVCGMPLGPEARDGLRSCVGECGDWIENSSVLRLYGVEHLDLGPLTPGAPYRLRPDPGECPQRGHAMRNEWHSQQRYSVCVQHGVWIPRNAREAFTAVTERALAHKRRRAPAVVEATVARDETDFAGRISDLEQRIADLEATIAELRRRM